MKKILCLLFVFVCFGLFACNDDSTNTETTPDHTHDFSTSYSYDANNHWHDCVCGEQKDLAAHSWDSGEVVKEATEESAGEKKYVCTVCGKSKTETIPMLVHVHDFADWVNEVAPTCEKTGSKGYRYCNTCEKYFDQNMVEMTEEEIVIPMLEHKLEAVERVEASCTTTGNLAHFKCENCDKTYVLTGNQITMPANSQWAQYPFGNFSGSPSYIVSDGTNAYLKIQPAAWYPTQTGFSKDMGNELTKAGTYVLSFDIMGSPKQIQAINAAKLDIIFFYNGGTIKISDGVFNLTTVKSDEWTTLTFEFTVPAGISSDYTNCVFYYWAERTLEDNYLLIDNYQIYAKDDAEKKNLDVLGMGDFDGFFKLIEKDVVIPVTHQYGDLVEEVKAVCGQTGMKAYYNCEVCGKYFDAEKNEVAYDDLMIEAVNGTHSFSDLYPEEPATCTESGIKAHYYCEVCDSYFDENKDVLKDITILPLGHNFTYTLSSNTPCTEGGYISHNKCENCGLKYGFAKDEITMPGNASWTVFPYGNWTQQEIEVYNDDSNTCLKIAPCEWYPSTIGFKKDVSTNILLAGNYRLLIDVKGGPCEYVNLGKLDLIGIFNGGKLAISDGVNNLGSITSTSWTTLEFEFTVPTGINSTYFNLDGYYWPENTLSENYLLIDNIRFVKADDETNTNIDTMGFGDLEGLLPIVELDSVLNHNYDDGVITKEATETEDGIKTFTCQNCGDTYTKPTKYDSSISILSLGNSYADDSIWLLYDILESLGYEDIYLGALYIGGSYSSQHRDNILADAPAYEYRVNYNGSWITTRDYKISDAINSREWDFLISNQASVAFLSSITEGIEEILNYFEEEQPNAKKYWNLTWSHSTSALYGKDYHGMYLKLMENAPSILESYEQIDVIVPTGTAVENIRHALDKGLMRDDLHLDLYVGRYTAALTLAKAFTGRDIANASHPASVTNEEFELIVKAVNAAFETKYAVTDIK